MRLRLESPCPMKLGQFPDKQGHTWHCGQCDQRVYDLSEMGPERAAELLQARAHGEDICAQWVADRHGNVIFNTAWAAAAAIALATPAFADGGDSMFDAIQLLIDQNNAANELAHQQAGPPTDPGGTLEPEPVYPMAGGIRAIPTPPPHVTPPKTP